MSYPDDRHLEHLPAGVGRAATECGDAVEIRLWTSGDRIRRVEFETHGCQNTLAAAAAAAELARQRTLVEALAVDGAAVQAAAVGLAPGREHVAELAAAALRAAAREALVYRHEPWRRLYRPDRA